MAFLSMAVFFLPTDSGKKGQALIGQLSLVDFDYIILIYFRREDDADDFRSLVYCRLFAACFEDPATYVQHYSTYGKVGRVYW